jgi:putative tricarboxylic transport membrane protein
MFTKYEFHIALLLVLVGFFVLLTSNTIPLMVAVEKSSVINARFFPKLMGGLLILLSIGMAVENYFRISTGQSKPSDEDKKKRKGDLARLGAVALICLLYYLLFQPLGFLLSSLLFMLGFLTFLGVRKWHVILPLSVLVPLCVYLLFKTILGAPLPDGLLYF